MGSQEPKTLISKFSGSGWSSWSRDLKMVLMHQGLWSCIASRGAPGTDSTEREKRLWEERQEKALATIYLHLEARVQAHLDGIFDPKLAWERLNFIYAKPLLLRNMQL